LLIVEATRQRLRRFALRPSVSHRYAHLYGALHKAGKPVPTNALWIAAIAIEHGLVLYTRDAHFLQVPGLACMWRDECPLLLRAWRILSSRTADLREDCMLTNDAVECLHQRHEPTVDMRRSALRARAR
jgi:hypothetical protein